MFRSTDNMYHYFIEITPMSVEFPISFSTRFTNKKESSDSLKIQKPMKHFALTIRRYKSVNDSSDILFVPFFRTKRYSGERVKTPKTSKPLFSPLIVSWLPF